MNITEPEKRRQLLKEVEGRLAHTFKRNDHIELALTHSSFANEKVGVQDENSHQSATEHNERMEFLGDAVLELCVSHVLFKLCPTLREGALTKIRSNLVSTTNLARMARELALDNLILLGHGEELQGGRQRDSVLSDTFEAVIAAVYMDGGFQAALKTIQKIFNDHWDEAVSDQTASKDNKTRLQEIVQQRFKGLPVYNLAGSIGPEHAKIFIIDLKLPDGHVFQAQGPSYKKAEQEAARLALETMEK
ncbi:MAG: ribonuclease III [Desulfovibrionaceae bacterium]|nr:ribonuclease III [Desulfovibrionaceae bacterium]